MLEVLIVTVVSSRMSRCDTRGWYCNRAPAQKSLVFSYSKCGHYRCDHSSDADAFHIHSFRMWYDFFVLSAYPHIARSSIVVPHSVVCVLQTMRPLDSNDAFQLLVDPAVAFGCHNCVHIPTDHFWQKRNFYSVWIERIRSFGTKIAYFGFVGLFRSVLLADDPKAGFEIVFLIRL